MLLVVLAVSLPACSSGGDEDDDNSEKQVIKVVVPDVSSLNYEVAQQQLENAGLTVSISRANNQAPIDTVFSQDPLPGVEVNESSIVAIMVSDGVRVPDVLGSMVDTALTILTEAGFSVQTEEITGPELIGTVLSQSLPGESNAEFGSEISITVSRGIEVPDVINNPVSIAIELLEAAGLNPVISEAPSTVVIGLVAIQFPVAGAYLNAGSDVNVTVSTGIAVPGVVGQSLQTARQQLNETGLTNITEIDVESEQPIGTVLSQSPLADSRVNASEEMTLTYSRGIAVPDVVGENMSTATEIMQASGFMVSITQSFHSTAPVNQVFEQQPQAGVHLNSGGLVTLMVSKGPEPACRAQFTLFVTANIDNSAVSTVQGGLLYDNWWAALGFANGPVEDHPMWNLQDSNTRSGEETWRCNECHGWDYKGADGNYGLGSSHFTGFPGILDAQLKDRVEVFCAIREGEGINTEHRFNVDSTGGKMSDLAILQLTKFLTQGPVNQTGTINTDIVIDPITGMALGNSANGASLYQDASVGCGSANCHGVDGTQNVSSAPGLVGLSRENAWLMLHRIRFGHPGEPRMPAYSDPAFPGRLSLSQLSHIIAYAQQLLEEDSSRKLNALGGRLYDNWIMEKEVVAPPVDNPLWALQNTNTRTGADTWRCVECHGWDYKGAQGNYGPNSSHFTGFNGVLNTTLSEEQVVNLLTNGFFSQTLGEAVHVYAGLLSSDEILAVSRFIKSGTIDTDSFITSSGIISGSIGNFLNGQEQYSTKPFGVANGNCELCHGTDGKAVAGIDVGILAISNPWLSLHKARFGAPGSIMPGMLEGGLELQDSVDVIFYSQSLPQ